MVQYSNTSPFSGVFLGFLPIHTKQPVLVGKLKLHMAITLYLKINIFNFYEPQEKDLQSVKWTASHIKPNQAKYN